MIKYHRNECKNVQTYTGWRFHSPKQQCHTMAHITYLDGTSFWKCHSTWFMVCLCWLLDMDESGNMSIMQLSLQLIPQISILALTVLVMTKSTRLIFSSHITVCYMSPFSNSKKNMSLSSFFSSFQAPRQLLLKKPRKATTHRKPLQFDPLAFHEVFSGSGQVAIKPSWIAIASWTSARFVWYQSGRPPPEIKEAAYKRNKMEIHHDPSNHYFYLW